MPELTVASAVTAYLGGTTPTNLTDLINAAEDRIFGYCRRKAVNSGESSFARDEHIEYLSGELSSGVLLKFTPITAVSAVSRVLSSGAGAGSEELEEIDLTLLSVDGIAIPDLASNYGPVGRLQYRNSTHNYWPSDYATARLSRSPFPNFGSGRQLIKIAYSGGYQTIPGGLKMAATILAAQLYRNQQRDPTLTSERLGEYAYTAGTASEASETFKMPGGVLDLLEDYVNKANSV